MMGDQATTSIKHKKKILTLNGNTFIWKSISITWDFNWLLL